MLVMGEMLRRADLFESHQVTREVLSTRERMSEVLERLKGGAFVPFIQLFTLEEGKLGVVVTFMAILELVKEQMVELVQNEAFGAIHVRLRIAREAEEGETLEEALEDDFSERAAPLAVRPPADCQLFRASGFAPCRGLLSCMPDSAIFPSSWLRYPLRR